MLKLLAALFMVCDHFALVFLDPYSPLFILLRCLGRLSMPIFAYQVAVGFTYTRNFSTYCRRIFLMTLVSQFPFTWLIYGDSFWDVLRSTKGGCLFEYWNIGLTFLCALFILKLFTKYIAPSIGFTFSSLAALFGIVTLLVIGQQGDYGIYCILMVVVFYAYLQYRFSTLSCSVLLFVLLIFYASLYGSAYFMQLFLTQLPSLLSLGLINTIDNKPFSLPKHFFYWFYPVHMFLLLVLHQLPLF